MSMMDAGASGAMSMANTLLQIAVTLLRDLFRVTARVSSQLGRGSLHAAGAMLKSAQARADRGQVGLSRFTQLAQSREPVHVTDREVAKVLRSELKKHGATFAVEKHLDGSMTYHAEGKDATLIAHALEQAEKRVDELNRSRGEALDRGEAIPDGDEHHTIELNESQAQQLAGELRDYGQTLQDSGRHDDAATVESLAGQVEQNQVIPADAETLELVEEARSAHGATSETMQPVDEAIEDEQKTIEAEPYHALVDHSIDAEQVRADVQVIVPLNEAQAQQLAAAVRDHAQPAPEHAADTPSQSAPAVDVDRAAARGAIADDIEMNQSIELTPENTEILHTTFQQQGWTPGSEGDRTPRVMRDVVEVVEGERDVMRNAQTVEVERESQAQTPAAPAVDVPTQTQPATADLDTARSPSADPFGADEWGDDGHDIDEPTPELAPQQIEQEAPVVTLPPKPTISAADAARTPPTKTQQEQHVQAPSTTRERDGALKGDKPQKPTLGQVVGKIREARTETAKKDAAGRQAQRGAGLTPDQQAPQIPTGRSR